MRALIDAIEAEALGPIRHILHVGIGGSALGPDLLVDALGRDADRYDVAIVSQRRRRRARGCVRALRSDRDVARGRLEDLHHHRDDAQRRKRCSTGCRRSGVEDPYGRVIALTAAPDKAIEWGVDETRVLPFAESVGGRYSLWSSIGFPAAMALGWDAFEELLEGAAEMDRHFRLTRAARERPRARGVCRPAITPRRAAARRAACSLMTNGCGCCRRYLQQLEMESNGKGVTLEGKPVDRPTAPITWGGVGTDAQHAVFQLLHQGTQLVPARIHRRDRAGRHARPTRITTSCCSTTVRPGRRADGGQGAIRRSGARLSGRPALDHVAARRRSIARTLGALLAFYEHRMFVNGVLLGINSFDQFGVELGKEMAKAAVAGGVDFDPSTTDLIARAFP